MPSSIYLDTSIGDEVDDAIALAIAHRSDELELVGVSTVYGDVARRCQLARRILAEFGAEAVPVAAGESATLDGRQSGRGVPQAAILTPEERRAVVDPDGVRHMVDVVTSAPGTVTVVATGPLTNVATAIRRNPGFAAAVARIVVYGGDASGNQVERNFSRDPAAAAEVLASEAQVVLIGLDVGETARLSVDRAETLRRIESADIQLRCMLFRMWGSSRSVRSPGLGRTLAMACCWREDLVDLERRGVSVDTGGDSAGAVTVADTGDILLATGCRGDELADLVAATVVGPDGMQP